MEVEPAATFQQVKAQIERQAGVPPEKQRLLCNGKERKNGAETLAAAGVSAKSKMMLMLVPGYTMPPPPVAAEDAAPAAAGSGPADAATGDTAAAKEEEPAAVELEGELPLPEGAKAQEASATVHVRHGAKRYHVRVPHGLDVATFGELAAYLVAQMLPRGIPAEECRLICRGKSAESRDVLSSKGGEEMTVMLMFREGFHVAADGANWLKESQAELAEAEQKIERLGKQVEANFSNAETSVRLAELGGLVAMLKHSVEVVRISEAKLPEMLSFQERVLAADARLEDIRKKFRL